MNEPAPHFPETEHLPRTGPLPPPATVGMPLEQVDTPALLLDLDAFEYNLDRLTQSLRGTGMRLRPHAKSH